MEDLELIIEIGPKYLLMYLVGELEKNQGWLSDFFLKQLGTIYLCEESEKKEDHLFIQ